MTVERESQSWNQSDEVDDVTEDCGKLLFFSWINLVTISLFPVNLIPQAKRDLFTSNYWCLLLLCMLRVHCLVDNETSIDSEQSLSLLSENS